MLGSFIRLVDYMMVEALVDRTVGTVEELVAMLDAPHQSADKTHKVCCKCLHPPSHTIIDCQGQQRPTTNITASGRCHDYCVKHN